MAVLTHPFVYVSFESLPLPHTRIFSLPSPSPVSLEANLDRVDQRQETKAAQVQIDGAED